MIKCYLVSNKALQLNHTYYSFDEFTDVELFYKLEECTHLLDDLYKKTFVYEVEVKPEDVIECENSYLCATSFKITEHIDLKTIINLLNFSTQTLKEIDRIFNGEATKGELVYKYKKAFESNKIWTEAAQVKFLAILSQTRVELPSINISNFNGVGFIRLLEFYNKSYEVNPRFHSGGYVANSARREALKGSNKFEYIENEPIDSLIKRKNFYQLLVNRKLTQKQFEEYCEYKMNHTDEAVLSALAVSVGYKILPKYKKLFYPYVIYQDPELVKDIILSEECSNFAIKLFFDKGYKIFGIDYEKGQFNIVKNAKSIFTKDEYKYI